MTSGTTLENNNKMYKDRDTAQSMTTILSCQEMCRLRCFKRRCSKMGAAQTV